MARATTSTRKKTATAKTTRKTSAPKTTRTASTKAKTTTPRATTAKAAAKTAPTTPAPAPAPEATSPEAVKRVLRKRDLFERVKARASGVKGSDVRTVLDAALEELGALMEAGDSLNAPPLGTLRIQKRNEKAGGMVLVAKLRRKNRGGGGKDPLAEAAE
ncbi:MAG: hypothetical protein D6801_00045 [Alphaproteobacteria bacterium]|nr:MAG: hypothetical protein D6801_00045 [Alphaproteobacteria bacterium]